MYVSGRAIPPSATESDPFSCRRLNLPVAPRRQGVKCQGGLKTAPGSKLRGARINTTTQDPRLPEPPTRSYLALCQSDRPSSSCQASLVPPTISPTGAAGKFPVPEPRRNRCASESAFREPVAGRAGIYHACGWANRRPREVAGKAADRHKPSKQRAEDLPPTSCRPHTHTHAHIHTHTRSLCLFPCPAW